MNEKYIEMAIKESKKAYRRGEVPVGCIIVRKNSVIAKGHNNVEKSKVCTNHAEMIAIAKASRKLKNWRLKDCEMYVTLEPCSMCKSAIELSRIKKVYYCVEKNGESKKDTTIYERLHNFSSKGLEIIQEFFKKIR